MEESVASYSRVCSSFCSCQIGVGGDPFLHAGFQFAVGLLQRASSAFRRWAI